MSVTGYTQAGADAQFATQAALALKATTSSLATVATSGSYADLTNVPAAFSGSYTDLTNKPTIPAAQVQTDWNASTGLGQILNKPTLFSGSYTDLTNKPTLFSGAYADLTGKPIADSNPQDGDALVYDGPSGEYVNAPLTFDLISGTGALAQLAPGASFVIIYSPTVNAGAGGWTYAGTYITARPTARTDIFMDARDFTGNTAGTPPTFAIAGDSYDVKVS